MTPRYTQAIHFAAIVHESQSRKGTAIPYITHPVACTWARRVASRSEAS